METNIATLWIPTVAFAHLFAAFWLIKTLLLHDPQAFSCLCFWRRKQHVPSSVLKARAMQKAAQAEGNRTTAEVILHVPAGSAKASGNLDRMSGA